MSATSGIWKMCLPCQHFVVAKYELREQFDGVVLTPSVPSGAKAPNILRPLAPGLKPRPPKQEQTNPGNLLFVST